MNHKDSNGVKQGEWKTYYTNGNIRLHTHFKDNQYHGELRYWSVQGILREWIIICNGKIIMDFMQHPEKYPLGEDRTMFSLQLGLPLLPLGEL